MWGFGTYGPNHVVKRTVGAGGVFLGASGIGVSESVAVGALGVAVGLRSLLDFETPPEEEERGSEDGNVVGVNGDNPEVACLESLAARSLLRYLAAPIVTAFALWMEFLMKVKSCSSSSGRTSVGIE